MEFAQTQALRDSSELFIIEYASFPLASSAVPSRVPHHNGLALCLAP